VKSSDNAKNASSGVDSTNGNADQQPSPTEEMGKYYKNKKKYCSGIDLLT
jgi:hypothetical protein